VTAGASNSMFYPLTLCALQIVFMIMIMILLPLEAQSGSSLYEILDGLDWLKIQTTASIFDHLIIKNECKYSC